MKRTIALFSLLALLAIPARAQTNSGITHVWQDVKTFLQGVPDSPLTTNIWTAAVGPNYVAGKIGASAFVSYQLTPFIRSGIGLDYINDTLYESSFQTKLGTAYRVLGIDIYPNAGAGVGYAFAGKNSGGVNSDTAIGIISAGVEFGIPIKTGDFWFFKDPYLSAGVETAKYTSIASQVYKGFLRISFHF